MAVVSRHATRIFVCLFEGADEVARLPLRERLGDVHYGLLPDLKEGMAYGLRAEGPWAPEQGHRFDTAKLLLDPYATRLSAPFRHSPELMQYGAETAPLVPRAIAAHVPADAKALPSKRPEFIYEVPVKAFTLLHPEVPQAKRGTVAALAEPAIIGHLKKLGIDTVELMPVCAFIDERHLPALGLSNAWGYNPVSFLAPDPRLAPGGLPEIRATVDALHAAGIRVILDIVLNHTGESDVHGTTLSLRGLDHALYFRQAQGQLVNDTGCGNTLALDEPHVMQLAMDALRSWAMRTGVDGFRFDLATVMGRTPEGFSARAPLLSAIEQDPLLSRLTMIAEPWDVGPGGYRLGQFPPRWLEWNDRYRDEVRRFWRGDTYAAGAFATRIAGSSDLFAARHRPPSASVNFLAAHDGFTLRDAVTYRHKNNHANGEENRDGHDHEPTWPGGDVRALLATLFLSRGTPMLTAGDEFGRTQRGNNNAYAQDNETTWLDWAAADDALTGFTAELVKLRRALAPFLADRFLLGAATGGQRLPDAEWLGADGQPMNWEDGGAGIVTLVLAEQHGRLAITFNRGADEDAIALPKREAHRWTRMFCTASGEGLPTASVSVFREERVERRGITDDDLARLAARAGIANEWWEVDGTHHRVSPETQRSLLNAMGLACASEDDVADSLRHLANPGPIVARADIASELLPAEERRRRLLLEAENGQSRLIDVPPGEPLRLSLPAGRYRLRSTDCGETERIVLASPGQCHLPTELAEGGRVFGLAAHLYALRHATSDGIGDLETLHRFGSLTHRLGGRYAGLNPLHHLFPSDRSRASPYQPSDRHYIDPLYISIEQLLERHDLPRTARLAQEHRAAFARLEALSNIDYEAVWNAKSLILEQAFEECGGCSDLETFNREGGAALASHGRFEALRMGETVTPERIAYRGFLQWLAEAQLAKAALHGNLYRDLALGCAFDGGERDANRSAFAEGVSIGAPPDPFSAAGQVWNLPPFSPIALKAEGMEPMRRVISANMRHATALRIDHALGLARQFWVPRGGEGRDGSYVRFPLEALIAVTAMESQKHRCLVVGEDLGTVPEGLREQLGAANILSYRVLWFEREGLGFIPPERYPPLALACLASHDLPTFSGWRAGRDIEIARQIEHLPENALAPKRTERAAEIATLDRLSGAANDDAASAAAHRLVARAPSCIMLVQADDLAGERDPLNVPGTDREWPNWRRRVSVPVETLADTPAAQAIIHAVKQERPS